MITTKHKYIEETQPQPSHKYMILGTIHPHKTENFQLDYFYGNKNSIWTILSKAFPEKNFDNKENIKKTLKEHKVFITDVMQECDRKDEKVTMDAELKNIKLNTEQIKNAIKNTNIKTIYFTSAFGKNSATKLFLEIYKDEIPKTNEIIEEAKKNKEFKLKIENKEIKGILLLSPSGAANRGIASTKEYKEYKQKNKDGNVTTYKTKYYQEKFKEVFNDY